MKILFSENRCKTFWWELIAKEVAKLLIGYGLNNLNINKYQVRLYEFDSEKVKLP